MGHFITNSLEDGEQIVFKGRLHWSFIFRYLLTSFMLILVVGILMAPGKFSPQKQYVYENDLFIKNGNNNYNYICYYECNKL